MKHQAISRNLFLIGSILLTLAMGLVCSPATIAAPPSPDSMGRFGGQYPVILMAVPPTDKDFARAKAIGAEYVHAYGMSADASAKGMDQMQAYLDLARKHALKVMFDLDGARRFDKGEKGVQEMRQIVNRFKNDPALGFWYLCDEPDANHNVSPATLEQFYNVVKQASPNIPVCVVMTTGPYWKEYQSGYDIFSFDTYPIGNEPFPTANLENVTDFNHQAVKLGKPVMPCLQAFNWVFMRIERDLSKGQSRPWETDKVLKTLRYPTLDEMRYWNFATMVQGARGVMYYSYLRGIQTQVDASYRAKVAKDWEAGMQINPQWMDTTLKQSIGELESFTDLVKPAWDHQVIPSGWNLNLLEAVWTRGSRRYVVMVNAFPLTRSIYLTDAMKAPFDNAKVTPWGFSRKIVPSVRSSHQTVIEEMYPWEVLVWEIQPQ